MTDNKNAIRTKIEQTNQSGLLTQLSKEEMERITGGLQLTTETEREQTSVGYSAYGRFSVGLNVI
jgi:hypothetical protein